MRLYTLLIHSKVLSKEKVEEVRTAFIEGSHGHFIHYKTCLYSHAEREARDPAVIYVVWIDLRPDPEVGMELLAHIRKDAIHLDRHYVLNYDNPDAALVERGIAEGAIGVLDSGNWLDSVQVLWNKIAEVRHRQNERGNNCRFCELPFASPEDAVEIFWRSCVSCRFWLCRECAQKRREQGVDVIR